ncbi:MAG: hypothetical protein ACPG47_00560 [Leucothrix sp.]
MTTKKAAPAHEGLVDTSVWSLAFRRKHISTSEKLVVGQLQALILPMRS